MQKSKLVNVTWWKFIIKLNVTYRTRKTIAFLNVCGWLLEEPLRCERGILYREWIVINLSCVHS